MLAFNYLFIYLYFSGYASIKTSQITMLCKMLKSPRNLQYSWMSAKNTENSCDHFGICAFKIYIIFGFCACIHWVFMSNRKNVINIHCDARVTISQFEYVSMFVGSLEFSSWESLEWFCFTHLIFNYYLKVTCRY